MSLSNPVRYPVKIYRFSDKDAPILDGSPNCVSTIFKACLVTGYGDQEAAGWQLAFEDNENNVKVLRPPLSPETDFYLRLSDDNGDQVLPQVYLNMSDAHTGDLKLQSSTPFKYVIKAPAQKWVMLATERGFWFFAEEVGARRGIYFYCGDTGRNTEGTRGVYLRYTGGTWGKGDTDRDYFLMQGEGGGHVFGKLYNPKRNEVINIHPVSIFEGKKDVSANMAVMQAVLLAMDEVWPLPVFIPSRLLDNRDVVTLGDQRLFSHSTALRYDNTVLVGLDFWEL